LRALELDALLEQLTALEPGLRGESARATFEPVLADVRRARQALSILIDSFAAGEWRRRAIADPRPRHSGAADIIAVDISGLTLSIGGEAQPLTWAAFGGSVDALEQLFKGRLARSYTTEEDAAIATLLRLAAVGQATALAEQVLDPTQSGILQPSEVRRMQSAFEPAEAWISDGGAGVLAAQTQRLERERGAAAVLAEALLAAQAHEVSRAVATFEHLFGAYGDTLVVLLLADGSGWRVEPPPPTPDAVEPVIEPENGSGGEADGPPPENGE